MARTTSSIQQHPAAAVVIILILVVGGMYLFAPSLLGLSVGPKAPSTPATPVADWSAAFASTCYGVVGTEVAIPSTSGLACDVYAVITGGFDQESPGAPAYFVIVNLNTGDSQQSYQLVAKAPTFSSVSVPSSGASFPLILPSASNPALPDVVYVSGSAKGSQIQGTFYESFATSGSDTLTATMANNVNAFENMTVGQVYAVGFSIGGISLALNYHCTGA